MSSWNHTVITRKPCQCWGCDREIPAGTRVRICTEKDGGRFIRTRWCPVCEVFWERHARKEFVMAEIDGINHGEFVEPDWRDAWEAIRQELAEAVT